MEKLKKFFEEETFFEGSAEQIAAVKKYVLENSNVMYSCEECFGKTKVLYVIGWAKNESSNWTACALKNKWNLAVFENIIESDFEKRELSFWCNDTTHRYFDFETDTTFAGKPFTLTQEIPALELNSKVPAEIAGEVRTYADKLRGSEEVKDASGKIEEKVEEITGIKYGILMLIGYQAGSGTAKI